MSTAIEGKPEKSDRPEPQVDAASPEQGTQPLTKDWKHTLWYVGAAAAFLAVTAIAEFAGRPASIKEFGKVGQEFYTDFLDPTLATSLEVYVFDADSVRPIDFRINRLENGRWVIPSHHNYPADAEEQLGKTASSIIGITRGAMVTRWPADHAQYGVVDPRQDSLTVDEVDGVGQRIILRKDDDSVLADFIVGKQVDGETSQYYVRHPDEGEVYITKLDVDLSTKFTDWIDTDLFDFSEGEILRVTVNDYSFNELNGRLTERAVTTLYRDKTWGDDWKMDSLDEAAEEVNTDAIRDTLTAIADLEIAGVRPKQKGLTPDLRLDREAIKSQQGIDRLQQDLLARGFLLQPGQNGDSLNLISREGELYAGTEDGLMYRMHFGRVFTGSQEELEIGFASSSEDSSNEDSSNEDSATGATGGEDSDDDGAAEADNGESASDEEDTTGNPGRYLFVRVDFDTTLLGDELTAPVEPEKPAALVEAEQAEDDASSETTTSTDDSKDDDEESEIEKLRQAYEDAKQKYEDDLTAFEEFQDKVETGQQKAEELNRRFADWYYVIPGASFDKLKLARADLVKPKEADDSEDTTDASPSIDIPNGDDTAIGGESEPAPAEQTDTTDSADAAESDEPAADAASDDAAAPATDAPATDAPATDAAQTDAADVESNDADATENPADSE